MKIDVSVIIPAYNSEKTIKQCLESVLNQTLTNLEVIVINDGSTDGTEKILKNISDRRMTVITQENQGQGAARNTGIAASKGEYISFVDSDDYIDTEMLENMLDKAKKYDTDIVQCNLCNVYADGRKKITLSEFDGLVEISNSANYADEYMYTYIHSYSVCNKLFKRSFIADNHLSFSDTKKYFSEDLMFNLMMLNCLKRIYFISKSYYYYMYSETSHSHTDPVSHFDKLYDMFETVILNERDKHLQQSIKCIGAIVFLFNLAIIAASKPDQLEKYIHDPNFRSYLKTASKKDTLKRKLLFSLVLYLPMNLKIIILKFYYRRLI